MTTTRERLIQRAEALPLRTLAAAVVALRDATGDAERIAYQAASSALARRADRYVLDPATVDSSQSTVLATIVDQVDGATVITCHPDTAKRWLAWYAGELDTRSYFPHDMRVCRCGHLCASHGSTTADHEYPGGIGNGQCGFGSCTCGRLDAVIVRPARWP
jgi:hypothetical protein